MPGVISTAGSSFIPPFNWTLPVRLRNPENDEEIVFDGLIMGKGMTELLSIEIIEGEPFGEFNESKHEFIFNESAALMYKLKAGEMFNGFSLKELLKILQHIICTIVLSQWLSFNNTPDKMRLLAVKTSGETDDQIKASTFQIIQRNITRQDCIYLYT